MEDEKDEKQIAALNDELLVPTSPDTSGEPPKRNTKAHMIARIIEVAEQNDLELTVSNTQLKRMNKTDLHKLLGELVETGVKQRVAESVGATGTDDKSVGLATLRMVHDTLAMATQHGVNTLLPKYGYEMHGFCESLNHPIASQCVDDALMEIAQTSDVLQYVQSPFARLAIAWGSAMSISIRKKPINNNKNVKAIAAMGPTKINTAEALRRRASRRAQARQELSPSGPPRPDGPKPV